MSFRTAQVKHLFSLLLAIILLLCTTGCGLQLFSKSNGVIPQPGEWIAEFSIDIGDGKTENWIIDFKVSEDGKTVPVIQFLHYIGELKSGTQVVLSADNPPIENDTFVLDLFEYISFTQHKYEGSITFISSKEAEGTLNIDGVDQHFTAAPFNE